MLRLFLLGQLGLAENPDVADWSEWSDWSACENDVYNRIRRCYSQEGVIYRNTKRNFDRSHPIQHK